VKRKANGNKLYGSPISISANTLIQNFENYMNYYKENSTKINKETTTNGYHPVAECGNW
jgi:hypothetical protein